MKELDSVVAQLIADLRAMGKDEKARVTPTRPHVLVVEDDPVEADLISIVLRLCECDFLRVSTGEQAMVILENSFSLDVQSIDMVFLDLNLPGMSGVDVLEQIRLKSAKLPVVLMTSPIYAPMIERASKLGYLSMIEKPLRRDSVNQLLARLPVSPPPPEPPKDSVADSK